MSTAARQTHNLKINEGNKIMTKSQIKINITLFAFDDENDQGAAHVAYTLTVGDKAVERVEWINRDSDGEWNIETQDSQLETWEPELSYDVDKYDVQTALINAFCESGMARGE